MLHLVPQLPGPQLFCGPTAICAVTGIHQHDVLAAAHRYIRRPFELPIVGMTNAELIGTLALLGWRSEQYFIEGERNPTLRQFIKDMQPFYGAVILQLTRHFCTVTYTEYLCNQTDGVPVPLSDCPNQFHRVNCIIEVAKL